MAAKVKVNERTHTQIHSRESSKLARSLRANKYYEYDYNAASSHSLGYGGLKSLRTAHTSSSSFVTFTGGGSGGRNAMRNSLSANTARSHLERARIAFHTMARVRYAFMSERRARARRGLHYNRFIGGGVAHKGTGLKKICAKIVLRL